MNQDAKFDSSVKILITGDLHNRFEQLNALIARRRPELVICAGDFGYWPRFTGDRTLPLSAIKLQTAEKLLWCEGNHEDFWSLKGRESDEIEPGIIYMPRGSTYTLPDGRIILFMGGAESIDKMYRTEGIDWFREEIITQKDFQNLPEGKVDIFVTHTCPTELVNDLRQGYPEKGYEPSNKALSQLWKMYSPKLWFFGHWHQHRVFNLEGTQFYALSAPGCCGRWWMWLPELKAEGG